MSIKYLKFSKKVLNNFLANLKLRVRNFRRKKIRCRKIGRTEFSPQLGTNRIRVHFRVYSVSGHVTISRIIGIGLGLGLVLVLGLRYHITHHLNLD